MVEYAHGCKANGTHFKTTLKGYEPVGLLLNREEFDDVVKGLAVVLLGPDLQDFIV